ncbi:beta-ketoacyl-[acyl-carrier-protein] synthase family protein [Catalinimonas niigatensis]|uniref:hypothetical protein n=1 Tax=Catalinimonas niigatensis TaxID=1397264 RepID=UPI002664EF51|nr:hypothetical protein [Catalinimonas niigatensis]WPP48763.1 hypothetical protein PZB72_19030 [Catalinimonas niigatensis]
MKLVISAYSTFMPEGLFKNGSPFYENQTGADFNDFSKKAYRYMNLGYAKFFKMDELCKLAFLSAELLLKDKKLQITEEGTDIALVLGNKHSSLVSDMKHYESYQNRDEYFPSPAVFVYTLPNIMMGELCIRHQIRGENSCFMMDEFQANFVYQYVHDLFEHEQYNYCITGWVDYSLEDYNAALCLVEKSIDGNKWIATFEPDFMNLITARYG